MLRTANADVSFTPNPGSTQIALMIAVAQVPGLKVSEELDVTADGEAVEIIEVAGAHHGRIHLLELNAEAEAQPQVQISYRAEVDGDPAVALAEAVAPSTTDLLAYLRPSRYAESDRMLPTARALFDGLSGIELADAVGDYVFDQLSYVPGSSRFTDGAVHTLLGRAGVCRDYAHLVVALLRGLDVPARCAAVYAPGLSPMDFHAVAEAWVDGYWHVIDATRLAPRQSLLRIATGRDAADNAFLSAYGAGIRMGKQQVMATVRDDLPLDDHQAAVRMP